MSLPEAWRTDGPSLKSIFPGTLRIFVQEQRRNQHEHVLKIDIFREVKLWLENVSLIEMETHTQLLNDVVTECYAHCFLDNVEIYVNTENKYIEFRTRL